jgi:hypothetical protein
MYHSMSHLRYHQQQRTPKERMATVQSDMKGGTPSVTKRHNLLFGDVVEEHSSPHTIGFSDLKVGDFAKPVSGTIDKC